MRLIIFILLCVVLYSNAATYTNLDIRPSGISITPQSPSILNLIGINNNQSAGPHITTYTSADNHPLKQSLSYQHNNIIDCYDCYWDGSSWRSSYSGSYFRITKGNNKYSIEYGSGSSAGNAANFNNGLSINTVGTINMNNLVVSDINTSVTINSGEANMNNISVYSGIILPYRGVSPAILDFYGSKDSLCGFHYSGMKEFEVPISYVRKGEAVTLTIKKVRLLNVTTGSHFSCTVAPNWHIKLGIDPKYLPRAIRDGPDQTIDFPVYVYNSGIKLGLLRIFYIRATSRFDVDRVHLNIYNTDYTPFTIGNDVGWDDINIKYKIWL